LSKILQSENIDFGFVEEFQKKKVSSVIENIGTEPVNICGLVSSNSFFEVFFSEFKTYPKFPANSTIYIDEYGKLIDSTGAYYTTSQGYGSVGTTDSDGLLTPAFASATITLDDSVEPFLTGDQTLDEDFEVSGTATGLAGYDVEIQAKKDSQAWSEAVVLGTATITAGAWSKANCQLSSTDFAVSDSIDIRAVYNSIESNEGNLTVVSVSEGTLTMDATATAETPTKIETEAGTLTMNATCEASTPENI
jgi:hypothetical protein